MLLTAPARARHPLYASLEESVRPLLYSLEDVRQLRGLPDAIPYREFPPSGWVLADLHRKAQPALTLPEALHAKLAEKLGLLCKNWNCTPDDACLIVNQSYRDAADEMTNGLEPFAVAVAETLLAYARTKLPAYYFDLDLQPHLVIRKLHVLFENGLGGNTLDQQFDVRFRLNAAHADIWNLGYVIVSRGFLETLLHTLARGFDAHLESIAGTLTKLENEVGDLVTSRDLIQPSVTNSLRALLTGTQQAIGKLDEQFMMQTLRDFVLERGRLLLQQGAATGAQSRLGISSETHALRFTDIVDQDGTLREVRLEMFHPESNPAAAGEPALKFTDLVPKLPHKLIKHRAGQLAAAVEEMGHYSQIAKDVGRLVSIQSAIKQENSTRRLNFLFLLGALAQLIGLTAISASEFSNNLVLALELMFASLSMTMLLYVYFISRPLRT